MLLQFGVAALRAGNTAARTREHTGVMAQKLGLEGISASFTLDSVTVSVKEPEGWLTAAREIGPPGINVWRIGELERLADGAGATPEPRDIAAKLAAIQSTPPQYSRALLALAIAAASAGFAFLNGAAVPEMLAAAVGGGIGQTLRSVLVHRSYNQYGVAALAAVAASGAYVLAAALASRAGLPFAHYPAGFIASVLFLVPGFPLIAALFDMLQNQTTAAVGRLAQGMMLLACVALGLSIVIAAGGVDIARQPPPELVYPLKIALRAVAKGHGAADAEAEAGIGGPGAVVERAAGGRDGLLRVRLGAPQQCAPGPRPRPWARSTWRSRRSSPVASSTSSDG